ncbi:MAG: hypothetical protein Q8891_16875 [Bacteroidota bacterium]|nr:hypothetical protein [Bacteroidota bacterium]
MKKIAAILFLAIYLFSTTEAIQLLKLPVIFEHYKEHKNKDHSITFLKFLDIHYMHGSPQDADRDRDMQLPFKTSNECIFTLSVPFIPFYTTAVIIQQPATIQKKNPFGACNHAILPSYYSKIWQPPRSC